MKEQDRIIKDISLRKHKDPRVIQKIVYHPFQFAKEKMVDPDDERPIRIRYFGAFVQKYLWNKSTLKKLDYIHKKLLSDDRAFKMLLEYDPTLPNANRAWEIVYMMFKANNKKEIEKIYELLFKAIGK